MSLCYLSYHNKKRFEVIYVLSHLSVFDCHVINIEAWASCECMSLCDFEILIDVNHMFRLINLINCDLLL